MQYKTFFTELQAIGLSSPQLRQPAPVVVSPATPVPVAKVEVSKVSKDELVMGIKVEMEHTKDPREAAKIALDHLKENPKYYSMMKRAGLADELKDGGTSEDFKDEEQYAGKIGGTPPFPGQDGPLNVVGLAPICEATNHMGERCFQTYQGWLRAIKQLYPGARIDGDKDIAAAITPEGKGIGEWDGAQGCIYNSQPQVKDYIQRRKSTDSIMSQLHEGGSTITDFKAGLTSDMKKGSRWTITAFQPHAANKSETPAMKKMDETTVIAEETTKHIVQQDTKMLSGEDNKDNMGDKNRLAMTEIHQIADKASRVRSALESCGLPDCPNKHALAEIVNLMESIYHNIDIKENATGMKRGFTNEQSVKVGKVGNITAGQIRESISNRLSSMVELAECGEWDKLTKSGLDKTAQVWESIFNATK
jgi:hypothetical protein